jgi:pyruvate dehydrogenase (quinone)/pyruvate oxidase
VGDGGFSMLIWSCDRTNQLLIKVIIIKNNSLGMIKWEQMVFLGNPEFGCDLQPVDFVAFAKACGGTGVAIEDPRDCGRILQRTLDTPGPVIVEAIVDPFTPPMPAGYLRSGKKFAESSASPMFEIA